MRIFYLLFLLFAPFIFLAQNITTDTAKARKLINIGNKFNKKKELEQANYYYEQAIFLDKQHKNYKRYLISKNKVASNKRQLREYAAAVVLLNEIIQESRALLKVNHRQEAIAYSTLAIIKSINNANQGLNKK